MSSQTKPAPGLPPHPSDFFTLSPFHFFIAVALTVHCRLSTVICFLVFQITFDTKTVKKGGYRHEIKGFDRFIFLRVCVF